MFFRYLGSNAIGMAILDVGLFSGFEANKEDLEMVSSHTHTASGKLNSSQLTAPQNIQKSKYLVSMF